MEINLELYGLSNGSYCAWRVGKGREAVMSYWECRITAFESGGRKPRKLSFGADIPLVQIRSWLSLQHSIGPNVVFTA